MRSLAGPSLFCGPQQPERRAREEAARRRQRRSTQAKVAHAVAEGASQALARITVSLAAAEGERRLAEEQRDAREAELKTVRARIRELSSELEKLRSAVHSGEMARAERRLRLEQLETRAREEWGMEVETLVAEYGPHVPRSPSPGRPRRGGCSGSVRARGAGKTR